MTQDYQIDALKIAQSLRPRSILAIGPEADDTFAAYRQKNEHCTVDTIRELSSVDGLEGRGRYGLAFVSRTLEYLDKERACAIIAALRDLHAERLLAVVPVGSTRREYKCRWEDSDLLACGMHQIRRYGDDTGGLSLYEFDINNYKTTPDWLNNKYWANPELWGKYRW